MFLMWCTIQEWLLCEKCPAVASRVFYMSFFFVSIKLLLCNWFGCRENWILLIPFIRRFLMISVGVLQIPWWNLHPSRLLWRWCTSMPSQPQKNSAAKLFSLGWALLADMWLVYSVLSSHTLLTIWCLSSTMPRMQLSVMCVNSLHRTWRIYIHIYMFAHISLLMCSLCFLYLSVAGCEEDGIVGSLYPWPSSSYSHDWNPHGSPMGNLWCFQSFFWAVSFFFFCICWD